MFSLSRFFSTVSIMAFILIGIILSLVYWQVALKEVKESVQRESILISKSITKILENEIALLLTKKVTQADIEDAVNEKLKIFPTVHIAIFDIQGQLLIANIENQSKQLNNEILEKVIKEESNQIILNKSNAIYISYAKIKINKKLPPVILKIKNDFSTLIGVVKPSHHYLIFIIMIAFFILFCILFLIVYRANQFIYKQYQTLNLSELRLKRQNDYLKILNEVAAKLMSCLELEELTDEIIQQSRDLFSVAHSFIYLTQQNQLQLDPQFKYTGLLDFAQEEKVTYCIDVILETQQLTLLTMTVDEDTSNTVYLLAVPLMWHTEPAKNLEVLGVVGIITDFTLDSHEETVLLLTRFAHLSAMTINNVILYNQQKQLTDFLETHVEHRNQELLEAYGQLQNYQEHLEDLVKQRMNELQAVNDELEQKILEHRLISERLRLMELAIVNSNDAILITEAEPLDLPGPRIVFANSAFTKNTGYSIDEAIGKTPRILQGAKTHPASLKILHNALRQHQPVRVEILNYHKNGSEFWSDLQIVPIKDKQNHYTHFVSVQRDITQSKYAEQALRNSEQRLKAIFENAAVGIALLDKNGSYLQVNNKWAEMLGLTDSQLLQCNEMDVTYEADQAMTQHNLQAVVNHKKTCYLEKRYIRSDQSVFWSYLWLTPLYEADEQLLALLSIMVDIDKRKQAEAELQSSLHFSETLMQTIPIPIFYKDIKGCYLGCNNAFVRFTGISMNNLKNRTVTEIWPEEDAQHFLQADDALFKQHIRQQYEAEINHADGSRRNVIFNKAVFFQADGKPGGLVGTLVDITERKRDEAALKQAIQQAEQARYQAEQADKAKSVFLAHMSHELRTPLNGILGYAQLFLRDRQLNQQQLEGVKIIHRSGEHLLTLINDILDFSKIEAEKLQLHPIDFQLPMLIKDITDLFKMRASQQHIQFQIHTQSQLEDGTLTTHLPTIVRADEKRLRQVLLNLLGNAIKFTQQGHVTLSVHYQARHITFEIKDSGIGIAPDDLEQIFKPFQQVNNKNAQTEGTGLGLPISQRLVAMMGGELSVESELGCGSRFWFSIPLVVLGNTVSEVSASLTTPEQMIVGYERLTEPFNQPFNILVVDDAADNRRFLNDLLTPLGFQVTEANDGLMALNAIRTQPPDAVVMDIKMPKMDGLTAIAHIRNDLQLTDLVIIIASASVFEFQQVQTEATGGNAFIIKPIDTQAFLKLLAELCPIKWHYGSRSTDTSAQLPVRPQVMQQLPAKTLEDLLQLAEAGKVKAIIKLIQGLQQQHPEQHDLLAQVLRFAQAFEMKKLKQLLYRWQEENSNAR